jgi:hypothetical protein
MEGSLKRTDFFSSVLWGELLTGLEMEMLRDNENQDLVINLS